MCHPYLQKSDHALLEQILFATAGSSWTNKWSWILL